MITWDYLQDVSEAGSEDDVAMVETVEEIFNDLIGIIRLRENPDYVEMQPFWHLTAEDQKRSLIPVGREESYGRCSGMRS